MENKSVKTSGGALGWLSLTALFGLIGLRRYKKVIRMCHEKL